MKNVKARLSGVITVAFITAEASIYIAFNVIAALGGPDPIYLKYASVLLCLLMCLAQIYFCGTDAVIVSCAMAATAVSDLFILVLGRHYEIGLVTFIIAQSCYLIRMYRGRLKKIYITLIVRAAAAYALIAVLVLTVSHEFLVIECCIYIVMLAVNIADAFILCRRGYKSVLFAVGLSLFLCCDVCVGLFNFGSVLGIALPAQLISFATFAMWAFYLPSQVAITLSIDRKVKHKDESKTNTVA